MRDERWSRIDSTGRARYATVQVGNPTPDSEAVVVGYELFQELMSRAGFRLCAAVSQRGEPTSGQAE